MTDERFHRTSIILGNHGMENLHSSKIMIFGVGAVGGYAMEAIARSGVGHIVLVDFDSFDKTNINRQILALEETIRRKKVEVAKERISQINPECKVDVFDVFADKENISELLSVKPDFVVDAIDSLVSKCDLIEALWKNKIPFISSMGAALKTDVSTIKIAPLSQTKNCPLARQVRQSLRHKGVVLEDVACVYSEEQISAELTKGAANKILGSLPTITAIFGLMMANYAILYLAKAE